MNQTLALRTGRWALVAGVIGILAVGLLIAALAAPTPEPDTMRRETSLFAWQNAAVVLQALAMLPVTCGLYNLTLQQAPLESGRGSLWLGLVAQTGVVIASALLFNHSVSDMLYMGPIGLVGIWLLTVSRRGDNVILSGLVWLGRIAGVGLLTVGLGFLIYGAFVAPAVFIRPLTNAEIDAQSLTFANLIAHICMAVGTVLGRLIYPIWTIVLGRRLMAISPNLPMSV